MLVLIICNLTYKRLEFYSTQNKIVKRRKNKTAYCLNCLKNKLFENNFVKIDDKIIQWWRICRNLIKTLFVNFDNIFLKEVKCCFRKLFTII